MKFDDLGCLVREKYEAGHPGNLGDSLAETARYQILSGDKTCDFVQFMTMDGFLRHPLSPWREDDTSPDQMIPLVLAINIRNGNKWRVNWWRIPGTKTICPPGLWFAIRGHWRMLELANQVQGWLLGLSYRIADDGKLEKSQGKVQDFLNLIIIHLALKKIGQPTKLPRPVDECLRAIETYYLNGPDAEPNSEWLVETYRRELDPTYLQSTPGVIT
jgi:hypothetical protein